MYPPAPGPRIQMGQGLSRPHGIARGHVALPRLGTQGWGSASNTRLQPNTAAVVIQIRTNPRLAVPADERQSGGGFAEDKQPQPRLALGDPAPRAGVTALGTCSPLRDRGTSQPV